MDIKRCESLGRFIFASSLAQAPRPHPPSPLPPLPRIRADRVVKCSPIGATTFQRVEHSHVKRAVNCHAERAFNYHGSSNCDAGHGSSNSCAWQFPA